MRLAWFVLLAACHSNSEPATPDSGAIADAAVDAPVDRVGAATTTAQTNPSCTAIVPFYWEIGNVDALLASGSIGTDAPTATTVMAIASASKWLFGAYAVQKMGGTPTATAIPLFNFTSGYAGLSDTCPATGTVDDCLAGASGMIIPNAVGKFDYNGAHLQELASTMGLGPLKDAGLAAEVRSQIGTEILINYSQPQPAGGVFTSADQYVLFLKKLLATSPTPLAIATQLADDSVCTNPKTCATALSSPIPKPGIDESWHYGLAHWIEDDPVVGDGAFSSAGAFGFYPWIDSTRTLYGVLARKGAGGQGYDSAACGRLIRKAWVTGIAQ